MGGTNAANATTASVQSGDGHRQWIGGADAAWQRVNISSRCARMIALRADDPPRWRDASARLL
jgi:hypothetical protein